MTTQKKKESYDNFMSFGLYSGILRNIRFSKNAQNILEMFNDKKNTGSEGFYALSRLLSLEKERADCYRRFYALKKMN